MSEALTQLKGIIGSGFPGLAERILARHAQELATRQRRYADERFAAGDAGSLWHDGAHDAAALIDPEEDSDG
ncbi:hypothetical protein ACGF5F_29670 [Streptomyces sp. NPDC047821]|uniref:hypothetical protein n=1 Tax=Streptomyces sp. NPDC047821 TaxID=3365488 RepID=UPI003721E4DE